MMEKDSFQPDKKQNRLKLIRRRHQFLKKIQAEKKLDEVADKIQRESEE